jgi:aryl-alcohol dehydrogenase-like predicted oxidoreductase
VRTENTKAESNPDMLSKNFAVVERLREVGQRHGRPSGQVAIAWALHNSEVTGAIVGSRSAEQVERMLVLTSFNSRMKKIAEIEGRNTYDPS